MFGKKTMSSNDKFVMAQGRKAGNLKGNGKAPKSVPVKKAGPNVSHNINKLTGPSKDKGQSLGQQQTFKTSVSKR